MNNPLLQKASIVFSPTAYGTGTLNSIKPVQSFGSELVTNGTFDTDSNWTKNNATISGGKANFNIVGGAYAKLQQSITYVTGRKYRLTAVVNGTNGKAMRFRDDTANAGGLTSSNGNLTMTGSDQLVTFEWTANANSDEIAIERHTTSGDYTFTVDNVSIKEIIDADFGFDRNTTATRVNESELIETVVAKVPRINYTSKVGCVLFEPSRTNLVTYSQDFSQWSSLGSPSPTITTNFAISPDGTQNASRYVVNSSSASTRLELGAITVSAASHTFSLYIKNNTGNNSVKLNVFDGSDNNQTFTATDTWQRISYTLTTSATSSCFLSIRTSGDADFLIYGAQFEQQSFKTSFIPTAGTTITRAAETCNNSKPSVNSTEGVLYAEIAALANDLEYEILSVSDGSTNNRAYLQYTNVSNQIKFVYKVGGATQAGIGTATFDIVDYHKIACKWKANDFALWIDGNEVGTDTNGSVNSAGTFTQVNFDDGAGNTDFYGKVKGLAVYNEALSESQLMQLTGVTASSIYSNFVTRTASFTVEALNEVKKVIDNL